MRKITLWVVLVFIFTIPWETAITVSTLGTLSRLTGLCAAGVWGVSVLFQGGFRKLRIFHVLVFIYMAYNIASIFWAFNYDLTYYRVKTNLQLAILIWMLWDVISTPEAFRAAMQVFILGAYLAAGSSIQNFLAGQLISDTEFGRYSGAGQNAVEFAAILSLCLPMAWHLVITQKPGRLSTAWKVINFAFIPIAIFTIILTASRTALVAVAPGLLYIFLSMGNIKPVYRFSILLVFILAVSVGLPLIPEATLSRLSTIGTSIAESDVGGRVALWLGSLMVFQEFPVLGVGSGSLEDPNLLGTFAHNTFLSVLAELGIIGFLLFISVLAAIAYHAIRQPKPYAIFSLTLLATWLIAVMSLTWEHTKPTWFFLSLIVISAGIYGDRRSSLSEVPARDDLPGRPRLPAEGSVE